MPEIHLTERISGKGAKGLLVAFKSEETSSSEMETLERMIAAIKYNMEEDVFTLSLENGKNYPLSNLQISYRDILLFGVEPNLLGLQIETIQDKILYFENCRLLMCPGLKEINAVMARKQKLWQLLQEMFLR